MSGKVTCPACSRKVPESQINIHLDNNCSNASSSKLQTPISAKLKAPSTASTKKGFKNSSSKSTPKAPIELAPIFGGSQGTNKAADTAILHTPSTVSAGKRRATEEKDITLTVPPAKKTRLSNLESAAPLAERLRPGTLTEFVGQAHLTGPDSLLLTTFAKGSASSFIFWGPPGCGKTTLARVLAHKTDSVFKELSATIAGINEVRAVFDEAKRVLALTGRRTILFLDEVHRFSKSQQDIFLPFIEQGQISLIGATTENPSFKLTSALLSRCRVFVLQPLSEDELRTIIANALDRISHPKNAHTEVDDGSDLSQPSQTSSSSSSTSSTQTSGLLQHITPKIISSIVSLANGDARSAISLLDLAVNSSRALSEAALILSLQTSVSTSYDRTGESHYDMISALHKSVRGSEGSAAMYWLARMLIGGEDPMFIARRMVVCASEDIGLADPHALPLAMAALQACQVIGMPECRINLAHIVAYLAEAPKDTRSYEAYKRAEQAANESLDAPVPLQVRNAPTKLMANLGYADGYVYNPDYKHPVHNQYAPPQYTNAVLLRPAGDMRWKTWDEGALQKWEAHAGKRWEGRESTETS